MTNERKLSTSDIAASDERRIDRDRTDRDRIDGLERDRMNRPDAPVPHAIEDRPSALFADEEANGYRTRWSAIQTGFVDEPRRAVEEADTLVAELMKRLAEGFADERRQLESQWEQSDKVSTEDLRLAMRRYRSFFERLLSV
jgi:hypothetical protein